MFNRTFRHTGSQKIMRVSLSLLLLLVIVAVSVQAAPPGPPPGPRRVILNQTAGGTISSDAVPSFAYPVSEVLTFDPGANGASVWDEFYEHWAVSSGGNASLSNTRFNTGSKSMVIGADLGPATLSNGVTINLQSFYLYCDSNVTQVTVQTADGSGTPLGTYNITITGAMIGTWQQVSMGFGQARTVAITATTDGAAPVQRNVYIDDLAYEYPGIADGANVTFTATPDPGYVFRYWYGLDGGSTSPKVYAATNDMIVSGLFVAQYSLTVNSAHGSIERHPDLPLYDGGENVNFILHTDPGYIFTGWTGDASGTDPYQNIIMNSNKVVTANFSAYKTINITALHGTVTKSPDQASYFPGSSVYLTASPDSGYTFAGWSGDTTSVEYTILVTMNADKNFTATFEAYKVLTTNANHGTIVRSPDHPGYAKGSFVQLLAIPDSGYTFAGWSGDTTTSANPIDVTMNADKSFTALFEAYKVLNTSADHGTITRSPNQSSYAIGSSVSLSATPDDGYTFIGWSGDTTTSANPLHVTMNSDKSFTATFEPFKVLTTSANHGSIMRSPDQASYAVGSAVQLTAVPDSNYTFTGWGGDTSSSQNPITVTMNGDRYITAAFTQYPTLSVFAFNGTVEITPNQTTFVPGTMVTIHAVPNRGYVFNSWVGDTTTSNATITFSIYSNTNIATFCSLDFRYASAYRTFTYDSLIVKKPVKKANADEFAEFRIANTTTQGVSSLNVLFKNPVYRLESDYPGFIASGSGKSWMLTGGTLSPGDTLRMYARSTKAKPQMISSAWLGPVDKSPDAKGITATREIFQYAMPNAANVREELFAAAGFSKGSPWVIGKARSDDPKHFGWVAFQKAGDFYKSLSDKTGLHTLPGNGFDNIGDKRFVGAKSSLPPAKHNDKTFADLLTLKFNILLSQYDITPSLFQVMQFHLDGNPYSDMLLTDIAALGDSMMTYHNNFASGAFITLDSTLNMINSAFSARMDTLRWAGGLQIPGYISLIDVPYLQLTNRAPVHLTPKAAAQDLADEAGDDVVPELYALAQNYPNPFNPTTNINFGLPTASSVTITVYNMLGQMVATLADHEQMEEGEQSVSFDGAKLASGVYFYRLEAMSVEEASVPFIQVRKMLLVK